jgi:drug/metabolite transporter (DMT)-like permease
LLLSLSIAFHSIWHVIGKAIYQHSNPDPVVFIFYRCFFASIVLLGVSSRQPKFHEIRFILKSRAIKIFFLGCCMATSALCFLFAVRLSSPSVCAMLQPTVPVFVYLLSIALKEPTVFSYRKTLGVSIAAFGAAAGAISVGGEEEKTGKSDSSSLVISFALLLLQCICMAMIIIYQKRILIAFPGPSAFATTGLIYSAASMVIFPIAVVRGGFGLEYNSMSWLALLYCVLFATAFSYGVIAWSSKRGIEGTTVSVFVCMEPFLTAILSKLWLNLSPEDPIFFTFSGVLVCWGVFLVVSNEHSKYEPIQANIEMAETT